jgi:hypothetical protein
MQFTARCEDLEDVWLLLEIPVTFLALQAGLDKKRVWQVVRRARRCVERAR